MSSFLIVFVLISFISFVPEIYVSLCPQSVTYKPPFPIYTTELKAWKKIFESCDFLFYSIFRVISNVRVILIRM
jgi:hypothetical protein